MRASSCLPPRLKPDLPPRRPARPRRAARPPWAPWRPSAAMAAANAGIENIVRIFRGNIINISTAKYFKALIFFLSVEGQTIACK